MITKIRNTLLISFLFILCSNFGTCGCNKDEPRPTYYADQTIKDFGMFDKGSWWIYEEEFTSRKDTIKVVRLHHGVSVDDIVSYNIEIYSMRQISTILGKLTTGGGGYIALPELNTLTDAFVISPHPFVDETFVSTLDTGFYFKPKGSVNIHLLDTLPTYQGKNHLFKSVRVFENLIGNYNYYQKKIYWAKHVGKIRIERGDGSIWNLIDYEVSQDDL